MERNMGTLDRLLRVVVVAPLLIVLSFVVFGVWSVLGIVALVLAGVMLVTSILGFCPTYTLFGISTRHGGGAGGHRVAGLH
jgi:Inner membrane protein YgaP-like, transmembrane domain